MIVPIYCYGSNVLRQKANVIEANDNEMKQCVKNLWDTMYNAGGVGLAAPQIGISLRLFVIDSRQFFNTDEKMKEKFPDFPGEKEVFINPKIVSYIGHEFDFEEGCLSIPGIKANVSRPTNILMEYYNENFTYQKKEYYGITGRIIQHEYDHIEGKLFTDYFSILRKKTIKKKLNNIQKCIDTITEYPMAFK